MNTDEWSSQKWTAQRKFWNNNEKKNTRETTFCDMAWKLITDSHKSECRLNFILKYSITNSTKNMLKW